MFRKELYADWIILICVAVLLVYLYKSNLTELLKRLLEWTFVAMGFKLIIDYGILPKLRDKINKENHQNYQNYR